MLIINPAIPKLSGFGLVQMIRHNEKLRMLPILLVQDKNRSFDERLLPSLREYHDFYGLTAERLAGLADDAIVMHPGPVNRGVELAAAAADSEQSAILTQVETGVFVRMSVLYLTVSAAMGM